MGSNNPISPFLGGHGQGPPAKKPKPKIVKLNMKRRSKVLTIEEMRAKWAKEKKEK